MTALSLVDRLTSPQPLLLDGAIGTELARQGVSIDGPLWSAEALLSAPDTVAQIHRSYIEVGADILTANTFRTHGRNLDRAGQSWRAGELTKFAVEIARQETGGDNGVAWVAGSQAPLEDCYRPDLTPAARDLEREHHLMAENLALAGVDFILAETHPTIREALAVVRAAQFVGLPVMVSFVCGRDGRLLSGESVVDAATAVLAHDPLAILVNCLPAETAVQAVRDLKQVALSYPVGVYANVGSADDEGHWTNSDSQIPAVYAGHAETWLSSGANLIGGCCGTTPPHIGLLRQLIGARQGGAVLTDD